jgi:L,D-peptidoglycan transpeptidase YkuD (ErfK/YbiS/YcfS/YnhG family)
MVVAPVGMVVAPVGTVVVVGTVVAEEGMEAVAVGMAVAGMAVSNASDCLDASYAPVALWSARMCTGRAPMRQAPSQCISRRTCPAHSWCSSHRQSRHNQPRCRRLDRVRW